MKQTQNYSPVMLLVGIVFLIASLVGFGSLYTASRHYERTTAVIEEIRSETIYRHRKRRHINHMRISYQTPQHGELHTVERCYWPFRKAGGKVSVWYNPDQPQEIRLPGSEYALWGTLAAVGLLFLYIGLQVRKGDNDSKSDN